MPDFVLKNANAARTNITNTLNKDIRKMYNGLADNMAKEAEKLKSKDNVSSKIRRVYLNGLEKELKQESSNISKELKDKIVTGMTDVSSAVVSDVKKIIPNMSNIFTESAWSNVPTDIVRMVTSGQVYDGNWTLSSRIWGMERKTLKDINYVIAQGIAANKSAYDIAKDLEKYVNPKAAKSWEWSKVYPGTNKKIDFNAQRLSRTMVSHAYQQSFVATTELNPFVEKYRWMASNSDRVCPLCASRDGQVYDKSDLPIDHPMGMCTFAAVTDAQSNIVDRLRAWVDAPDGTYPEIDKFAQSLKR